jgi:hypothetical protein
MVEKRSSHGLFRAWLFACEDRVSSALLAAKRRSRRRQKTSLLIFRVTTEDQNENHISIVFSIEQISGMMASARASAPRFTDGEPPRPNGRPWIFSSVRPSGTPARGNCLVSRPGSNGARHQRTRLAPAAILPGPCLPEARLASWSARVSGQHSKPATVRQPMESFVSSSSSIRCRRQEAVVKKPSPRIRRVGAGRAGVTLNRA